jgi:hypothetical protein
MQDAGNTVTLAHYLELLGRAGILCGLENFTFEKVRKRKSSPRLMAFDTSLVVLASGASPDQLVKDTALRGHIVESCVGAYLLARAQEDRFEVFYWRDRNDEVDFVLQKGTAITALEVKSGRIKNVSGSLAFLKRYPQAFCLVVGSKTCSLEDFLLGKVELFRETQELVEIMPVSAEEVLAVFKEYFAERAASGVLAAQVASDIKFDKRKLCVTFDPAKMGIDPIVFESINPFKNLAEFIGIPISFKNSIGRRLRPAIDSVEALSAEGTTLDKLTTAELYSIGTGEEYRA